MIWNNLPSRCNKCNRKENNLRPCAGGRDITILGKEVKGICATIPLTWIFDPDENTINGIKRLLELERIERAESKAK